MTTEQTCWSSSESFVNDAQRLLQALHDVTGVDTRSLQKSPLIQDEIASADIVQHNGKDQQQYTTTACHQLQWSLHVDSVSNVFALVHPPIYQRRQCRQRSTRQQQRNHQTNKSNDTATAAEAKTIQFQNKPLRTGIYNQDVDRLPVDTTEVDDRLWNDPDLYYQDTVDHYDHVTNDVDNGTPRINSGNDDFVVDTTLWQLNLIYNDLWQCPIVYFTVQSASTGSPCDRSQVMMWLQNWSRDGNHSTMGGENGNDETRFYDDYDSSSSWDFVSYEMHPIQGIPSFFLHPCRTHERLETLCHFLQHVDSNPNISNNNNNDNSEINTNNDNSYDAYHHPLLHDNGALRLWSWMNMILPSVGYFQITPQLYMAVRQQIYMVPLLLDLT